MDFFRAGGILLSRLSARYNPIRKFCMINYLSQNRTLLLESITREGAIRELVAAVCRDLPGTDPKETLDAVEAREKEIATGIAPGDANVPQFVLVVQRADARVDARQHRFGADPGRKRGEIIARAEVGVGKVASDRSMANAHFAWPWVPDRDFLDPQYLGSAGFIEAYSFGHKSSRFAFRGPIGARACFFHI